MANLSNIRLAVFSLNANYRWLNFAFFVSQNPKEQELAQKPILKTVK